MIKDINFKNPHRAHIDILSDIFGYEGMKVSVEKNHQIEMEELQQKLADDNYQKGYSNANLEILDIQFQNYKNGQLPGNIILLQIFYNQKKK